MVEFRLVEFFSALCAFGPEAPRVVRFQWQRTCCGSGTARGSVPVVPPGPGRGDGISQPEAQGGHGQGHSQPAGAVGPAAAPALRRRPWKSAPAPTLRLGARGGEPQPRPSDSSSGLPAPGPVTPSGGRGWDGTRRAGMGADEGMAEPAGGFKCGPGRRRQHSRAARSGCHGLSPARTRRDRCRAAAMPH